jgi:threonine/homoserine/homoserine lactone efflux protein
VNPLYAATAVIELGAGLALLCSPSAAAVLLLGAPLEAPAAFTVARLGGAGLLALGVTCWLARGDTQSPSARGSPRWSSIMPAPFYTQSCRVRIATCRCDFVAGRSTARGDESLVRGKP